MTRTSCLSRKKSSSFDRMLSDEKRRRWKDAAPVSRRRGSKDLVEKLKMDLKDGKWVPGVSDRKGNGALYSRLPSFFCSSFFLHSSSWCVSSSSPFFLNHWERVFDSRTWEPFLRLNGNSSSWKAFTVSQSLPAWDGCRWCNCLLPKKELMFIQSHVDTVHSSNRFTCLLVILEARKNWIDWRKECHSDQAYTWEFMMGIEISKK